MLEPRRYGLHARLGLTVTQRIDFPSGNRLMRSRGLGAVFLALAGSVAILKGAFLMFARVDSGGGFVGEGMFYAGALQFVAASVLAVGLLAWCLVILVVRPLLPVSTIPNALIAMFGSGVVASPLLILSLRSNSLIHLEIFALLWAVLLPCLWGSAIWLSGRSRGQRTA